uniref:Uncharacterized protein n=1 Tax=Anopheles dirus TaxID=7168 RepID=A0A182NWR3_9DIPT
MATSLKGIVMMKLMIVWLSGKQQDVHIFAKQTKMVIAKYATKKQITYRRRKMRSSKRCAKCVQCKSNNKSSNGKQQTPPPVL